MLRLTVSVLVCTSVILAALPIVRADASKATSKPNVVIVMTDDQGYGDLSCHGNPVLKTPQIDRLFADSVRLADFHVAPTCSPTRCSLLTGHWTNRTGVWHTIMGRSMLRENEVTLGQIFQDNGYATGMFGKWHLGDNYPYRPEDRGFGEVLRHGGGGVGQTPDYWDNAYFDGSYFHNGVATAVQGFCTDVFFDHAKAFIHTQRDAGKPFLAYIATNAPHGPMHSPPQYAEPYQDQNVALANFFGMIANIDDNVGKLWRFLDEQQLTENTIFIFLTDNGTSAGERVFNAGMRGKKGSEYDGGHRVPCFVRWPGGGLTGGRDVKPITAAVDLVPTLIDLCEIQPPADVVFDGATIAPLLRGEDDADWPDRMLITDSQRVKDPIKWRKSAVMTSRFRLINGKMLYDMRADPGQQDDVASEYPEVVKRLSDFYERWWAELEPTFADETPIYLGHPAENPTRLTCHDWITEQMTPWHQGSVRAAMNGEENTGFWNVKVVQAGEYQIRLRRWPEEAGVPIDGAVAPGKSVPGVDAYRTTAGKAISPVKASLHIGDQAFMRPVSQGEQDVTFDVKLEAGRTRLTALLETEAGEIYGAYYVYVTKK